MITFIVLAAKLLWGISFVIGVALAVGSVLSRKIRLELFGTPVVTVVRTMANRGPANDQSRLADRGQRHLGYLNPMGVKHRARIALNLAPIGSKADQSAAPYRRCSGFLAGLKLEQCVCVLRSLTACGNAITQPLS